MAESNFSIGRGPDGVNVRVNPAPGQPATFGTPVKQARYNPGTLAQRMAMRRMQERARQRQRAGQPVKSGFTWQQNQAEWAAAQAEANAELERARQKFRRSPQFNNKNLITDEFSLDDFLPRELRADRGSRDVGGFRADGARLKDPLHDDPILMRHSVSPEPPVPPQQQIQAFRRPGVEDEKPFGPIDPTLEKYRQLRKEWLDAASKGEASAPDAGNDGDFGASGSSTSLSMGLSEGTGFPFLLVGDDGAKTIEKAPKLYTKLVAEALADPYRAGALMASLVAVGAYPGAGEKYVQDRLYLATDKDGQPTLKGRFTQEDADALRTAMSMISADQANLADAVLARNGSLAEIPGFEELLAQRGMERQDMASTSTPAGNSSGGGGGGGGYRRRGGGGYGYGGGGGGGGGSGAARLTDVEQLKSAVDSIARTRLGRVLTVEEAQLFANHYHNLERQSYASYLAGGGGTMLDVEAQAIAWIESRFNQENARQQQGMYVGKLLQMLQSGVWLGGGES